MASEALCHYTGVGSTRGLTESCDKLCVPSGIKSRSASTLLRSKAEAKKFKLIMSADSAHIHSLIDGLPAAELHVHIEGCMPPAMLLDMAKRNGLESKLPFKSLEEANACFEYKDLQEFLDLRDASLQVLVTERDFYEVMESYLSNVAAQHVAHTEIFFDPQVHTMRGVEFGVFMPGMVSAMQHCCGTLGITAKLLMCFMTELGPEAAERTLQEAQPYMKHIAGIGIARGIPGWKGERFPHSSFAGIYQKCASMGLRLTAHAGEEGPADEIWESIRVLKVDRIDHGVSCLRDQHLMDYLEKTRLPLTVCPLSNLKLQVYGGRNGNLLQSMKDLVGRKLCLTVNSDDPPFFGGYVKENYKFWADELELTPQQVYQLARNSVEASFLDAKSKSKLNAELEQVYQSLRL